MPGADAAAARHAVERAGRDATEMLAVLSRERGALGGREFAELAAVTADKERLTGVLETSARAAHDALAALDPDLLSAGAGARSGHRGLALAWQRTTEALARCHEENRTNGAIVRTLERSARHTLELIHHATGSGESVYGQSGETRRVCAHRYSTSA